MCPTTIPCYLGLCGFFFSFFSFVLSLGRELKSVYFGWPGVTVGDLTGRHRESRNARRDLEPKDDGPKLGRLYVAKLSHPGATMIDSQAHSVGLLLAFQSKQPRKHHMQYWTCSRVIAGLMQDQSALDMYLDLCFRKTDLNMVSVENRIQVRWANKTRSPNIIIRVACAELCSVRFFWWILNTYHGQIVCGLGTLDST